MDGNGVTPRLARFGSFELDLQTGELRKSGIRIRLQEQPFQVLLALLEAPGAVVSREQLRQRLWPDAASGEFEPGLNKAVNKVRNALSDRADHPRYIETVARRGYRFIGPVQFQASHSSTSPAKVLVNKVETRKLGLFPQSLSPSSGLAGASESPAEPPAETAAEQSPGLWATLRRAVRLVVSRKAPSGD